MENYALVSDKLLNSDKLLLNGQTYVHTVDSHACSIVYHLLLVAN